MLSSSLAHDGATVFAVIAGLDPAIHHLGEILIAKKMDARVKPGQHDRWVSLDLVEAFYSFVDASAFSPPTRKPRRSHNAFQRARCSAALRSQTLEVAARAFRLVDDW
jgi:hypothetical protein